MTAGAPDWERVVVGTGGTPIGGGIAEITSTDSSVTITDPTGPTTNLSVAGGGGPSNAVAQYSSGTAWGTPNLDVGQYIAWSTSGAHNVGSAIDLYGADDTQIEILTSGIYTIGLTLGYNIAVTGAGDWSAALRVGLSATALGSATSDLNYFAGGTTDIYAAGTAAGADNWGTSEALTVPSLYLAAGDRYRFVTDPVHPLFVNCSLAGQGFTFFFMRLLAAVSY